MLSLPNWLLAKQGGNQDILQRASHFRVNDIGGRLFFRRQELSSLAHFTTVTLKQ